MTTSTDFFADLERQLVTAAAERPARLRRARRRRAAVTVAAVLVAAGLIALAALAALPGSDRTAAPAHHGPSPAALRGIDVVVLDGSSRAGDARAVAGELSAAGASIVTVPDAPSMRHGSDEAATEVFFRPGHQADAITVAGTLQQEHESRYPPVVALPKQLRYVGSRAGIVVVAGSDHFMKPPYAVPAASPPPTNIRVAVLNATTTPGLARGVANRLQAAGFRIGTVTNAADQGRSATLVEYAPGQQAAALTTARAIDVPTNAVQPAAAGSRVIAGESAQVIVSVGADLNEQPASSSPLAGIRVDVAAHRTSLVLRALRRLNGVSVGQPLPWAETPRTTRVAYRPGRRAAARRVAHALGLPAAPLVPLAHAPAALRRTSADVVVIAGADIPL